VEQLIALLHNLVDAITKSYPIQDVEGDLRKQINDLAALAASDVKADIVKVVTGE
jgi:hypothetical protein